ncbi:MAG: glycosyltransferase [Dongiaceae bacterium]
MDVTIVIVPRDRYSVAPRTLRSLLANTGGAYRLVYVDAGSPPAIRDEIAGLAGRHGFVLRRLEHYVAPNAARNIGLADAVGDFVVFAENDVLFMPGWLEALVGAARATGAGIVSPLTLIGEPDEQRIHFCGGDLEIEPLADGRIRLADRYWRVGRRVPEAAAELVREPTGFSELHCTLVRRDLLERIGGFDEALLSCQEHIDLALAARAQGSPIVTEPGAQVSFYDIGLFTLADIALHRLRWGEDWVDRSAAHFAAKWRVDRSCVFFDTFYDWIADHRRVRQWWRTRPAGPIAAEEAERLAAADAAAGVLLGDPERLARDRRSAALLAGLGAPPAAQAAALLQSAYGDGRFPAEAGVAIGSRRDWLRERIGAPAEAIVSALARTLRAEADWALDPAALDGLPVELAHAMAVRLAALAAGPLPDDPPGPDLAALAPGGAVAAVLERLELAPLRDRLPAAWPRRAAPAATARRGRPLPEPLARVADPLAAIPRDAELLGLAVVKNECDVIEPFVRYNLSRLDGLLVMDHGSGDATRAILGRLAGEGLPLAIFEGGGPAHHQALRMNMLLRQVRAARQPRAVLALDGDEFVLAPGRDALLAALAALPGPVAWLPWVTYMPTVGDDPAEADPIRRIRHRRDREPKQFYKIALLPPALADERVRIGDGNHTASDAAGRELPWLVPEGLAVAHFPVRLPDQIRVKAAIGTMAVTVDGERGPGHGEFWRDLASRQLPALDDPASPAALQALGAAYSAPEPAEPVLDPLPGIPYDRLAYGDLVTVDGLGRLLDFLQEARGPLSESITRMEAELVELRPLREALAAERADAAALRDEVRRLGDGLRGLEEGLRGLEREAAALRGSTSWRVTAPLRWGTTLLRRTLQR